MDADLMMTSGRAATRLGHGIQAHHLRKLAGRREIPHTRAGHILLFRLIDLPAIREACERAGYYDATATEVLHAN